MWSGLCLTMATARASWAGDGRMAFFVVWLGVAIGDEDVYIRRISDEDG